MANFEYPCRANLSDPVSISGMTAAVNWEIAKGFLNVVVAAQGSASTWLPAKDCKFHKLQEEIDNFVKSVEDEELHC